MVRRRRAGRRGAGRRRDDAHRQRLRARARRRSRWTCCAPSRRCGRCSRRGCAARLTATTDDGMTATACRPLYRGGRVYTPGRPARDRAAGRATAGSPGSAPTPTRRPPTRVVDLDGALVTPGVRRRARARHRHRPGAVGLDLSGTRSAARGARRGGRVRRRRCRPTRWCSATAGTSRRWARADAADGRPSWTGPRGGRLVVPVPGVDPLGAGVDARCWRRPPVAATPGYDASGLAAPRRPPRGARRSRWARSPRRSGATAQRAALRRAASLGIAAVHECGGPGTSERGRLHRRCSRSSGAAACPRCTATGAS